MLPTLHFLLKKEIYLKISKKHIFKISLSTESTSIPHCLQFNMRCLYFPLVLELPLDSSNTEGRG